MEKKSMESRKNDILYGRVTSVSQAEAEEIVRIHPLTWTASIGTRPNAPDGWAIDDGYLVYYYAGHGFFGEPCGTKKRRIPIKE